MTCTKITWRPGKNSERAVRCCGCGATIAVAEASVTGPANDAVFTCSPACERKYEASTPDGGARQAKIEPCIFCGERHAPEDYTAGYSCEPDR